MTWNPTNANDVQLIIKAVGDESEQTIADTTGESPELGAVVVDEFTIGSEENLEMLSGIGNPEALGISRGDIEHTFSFTVQGEDADLFNALTSDEDGRAVELEIIAKLEDYKDKLTGAYVGTRDLSVSDDDPVEFEAEGMATGRSPGTVEGASSQ